MISDKYKYNSHYDWLYANLSSIFKKFGLNYNNNAGIIGAHSDKAYSYKHEWEEYSIHFFHGIAIYLLSYVQPYNKEVPCKINI